MWILVCFNLPINFRFHTEIQYNCGRHANLFLISIPPFWLSGDPRPFKWGIVPELLQHYYWSNSTVTVFLLLCWGLDFSYSLQSEVSIRPSSSQVVPKKNVLLALGCLSAFLMKEKSWITNHSFSTSFVSKLYELSIVTAANLW